MKDFFDNENRKLENFEGVKVLNEDIVDARRGYMHIRVSEDYLNNSFKTPVTLKYTHGIYQPVMLTFKDHEKYGAGVVFVSPERDQKAEIYLNQCFRFERQLPPIRYGRNLCIGYFNPDNTERNKKASADFARLEEFFKKRNEKGNP